MKTLHILISCQQSIHHNTPFDQQPWLPQVTSHLPKPSLAPQNCSALTPCSAQTNSYHRTTLPPHPSPPRSSSFRTHTLLPPHTRRASCSRDLRGVQLDPKELVPAQGDLQRDTTRRAATDALGQRRRAVEVDGTGARALRHEAFWMERGQGMEGAETGHMAWRSLFGLWGQRQASVNGGS